MCRGGLATGTQGVSAAAGWTAAAATPAPLLRVAIAGAGFSGAILARQLDAEPGVEVVCFESSAQESVRAHWTQPVTGAGLNINPNALATLAQIDPELVERLRGIGLPRNKVKASTVEGRPLYEADMVEQKMADTLGLRVRWDDANRLIRDAAGACIVWESKIVDHKVRADGSVEVTVEAGGARTVHGGFDLLVAGEGRYSPTRARAIGTPLTTFGDVCNFRILVPNCQPDGTPWGAESPATAGGLFDDLQLIYNDTPSEANIAADSPLRADPDFMQTVMRSTPRVGIMRIPRSRFRADVGESLYLFGNFAIPAGEAIPEAAKTAEAMQVLFTPAGGDQRLTAEGRFIRETLVRNAEQLHWARFQDIPVVYGDDSGHVLLLGDACHAFCPSLGQGATTSVEDACVAADEILRVVRAARTTRAAPACAAGDADSAVGGHGLVGAQVPSICAAVARRQAERMAFIRDGSTAAGDHVHFLPGESDGRGCLAEDAAAWMDDAHSSGWRGTIRRIWLEYPRLSHRIAAPQPACC